MRKLLLAFAFLFAPSIAWAQCTGVFPAQTVCGNLTGSPNVPTAVSSSGGNIFGPPSSTVSAFAVWGNNTGTLLADGAGQTVVGNYTLSGNWKFNGTNVYTGSNSFSGTTTASNFTIDTGGALTLPTNVNSIKFGTIAQIWVNLANQFWGLNAGNVGVTTAADNIGIGTVTMAADTSGDQNVAIGSESMRYNTTGSNNTCIGFESCHGNPMTGDDNVDVGGALSSITTGSFNIALGTGATQITSGNNNTVINGSSIISTGSNNTVIGKRAGATLNTGTNNLIICSSTGNCGFGIAAGKYNTVLGGTGNLGGDFSNTIIIGDGQDNIRADYGYTIASGTSAWSLAGALAINGVVTVNAGEVGMRRTSATATAPGAQTLKIGIVCGTNAGTAKLVAYAGTTSAATTIVDNIGAGMGGGC